VKRFSAFRPPLSPFWLPQQHKLPPWREQFRGDRTKTSVIRIAIAALSIASITPAFTGEGEAAFRRTNTRT